MLTKRSSVRVINDGVRGSSVLMMPQVTYKNMESGFAALFSKLVISGWVRLGAFARKNPKVAAAKMPDPPRFSERTYARSAEVVIARGAKGVSFACWMSLNKMMPRKTPVPTPMVMEKSGGASWGRMSMMRVLRTLVRSTKSAVRSSASAQLMWCS